MEKRPPHTAAQRALLHAALNKLSVTTVSMQLLRHRVEAGAPVTTPETRAILERANHALRSAADLLHDLDEALTQSEEDAAS